MKKNELKQQLKRTMENYTMLKACVAAAEKDGQAVPPFGDQTETRKLITAIDDALADVSAHYTARGQGYKWEAFKRRYVDGESYGQIADALNCGKNSPDRWCWEVMKTLGARLYGVDAVKAW